MSAGKKSFHNRTKAELAQILKQGDTQRLCSQPVIINTSHDVPDTGGISVDRKTVYIDRTFASAVKSGKVRVKGMTAGEIFRAIAEHEHTEICISQGDNAADAYPACHEFAERAEHNFVEKCGVDPEVYEGSLASAIRKCGRQHPRHPPLDLWCSPYLDDPDANDRRILSAFRRAGVKDAFKASKVSVTYGMGEAKCMDCSMFMPGKDPIRECKLVAGLVRDTRWCNRWRARGGDKAKGGEVDY